MKAISYRIMNVIVTNLILYFLMDNIIYTTSRTVMIEGYKTFGYFYMGKTLE